MTGMGWDKVVYHSAVSTADTTEALAPVSLAPGATNEWRIISLKVGIATGSSSPTNTSPIVQVRDSAGTVYYSQGVRGDFVDASDTGKYFVFTSGDIWENDTDLAQGDTTVALIKMPELVIPKNCDLYVYLKNGGTGDSVTVHLMAWQRSTF